MLTYLGLLKVRLVYKLITIFAYMWNTKIINIFLCIRMVVVWNAIQWIYALYTGQKFFYYISTTYKYSFLFSWSVSSYVSNCQQKEPLLISLVVDYWKFSWSINYKNFLYMKYKDKQNILPSICVIFTSQKLLYNI